MFIFWKFHKFFNAVIYKQKFLTIIMFSTIYKSSPKSIIIYYLILFTKFRIIHLKKCKLLNKILLNQIRKTVKLSQIYQKMIKFLRMWLKPIKFRIDFQMRLSLQRIKSIKKLKTIKTFKTIILFKNVKINKNKLKNNYQVKTKVKDQRYKIRKIQNYIILKLYNKNIKINKK